MKGANLEVAEFTLGEFDVLPAELCVLRNGHAHHLELKSMAVLLELAQQPDQTISRGALLDAVWPRGHVSDDVLSRCISQLRRAFGDSPRDSRYIATVPRRGYRLTAPIISDKLKVARGILVMPFQNLAANGTDEYLADGLTELLIARMAVASEQRVISRTTAMSFKGKNVTLGALRERLGVKWVIEGSLLQLGDKLQIVVQLIDAEDDAHTWSDTWTRPLADMMSVLNEVTRQISNQVQMRLEGTSVGGTIPQMLPEELMRRFLQGNHHASRRTAAALAQAMTCFEEVLREVPEYAPAMAGLAMCHVLRVHYGAEPAPTGIPRARELAQKALAVDPSNAEAMAHLGAIHFFYDWDFEAAAMMAQQSRAIRPQFELAMMLAANVNLVNGHYEKSQSLVDRAIATDPLNVGILMNAGDLLILQRRFGEAINCLSQALELQREFRPAGLRLALAQALHGQLEAARRTMDKTGRMAEVDATYREYEALVCDLCGDRKGAVTAARAVEQFAGNGAGVLPWSLARAWAAAGDEERAIEYLQRAFDSHSSSMPFLGQTPVFSRLRRRAEVRELMRRTGLPV